MDASRAGELQVLLEGVPLPAEKAALLAYAVGRRAEPTVISALRALPDQTYASLDAVTDALIAQRER